MFASREFLNLERPYTPEQSRADDELTLTLVELIDGDDRLPPEMKSILLGASSFSEYKSIHGSSAFLSFYRGEPQRIRVNQSLPEAVLEEMKRVGLVKCHPSPKGEPAWFLDIEGWYPQFYKQLKSSN
jgi:hypothetical protein